MDKKKTATFSSQKTSFSYIDLVNLYTSLKGEEFDCDALSNEVAHKTITKIGKNRTTAFDRALPLNPFCFSHHH